MHAVLLIVHGLIVLALIVIVLLQRSEGGALGMGAGGGGGFMTSRGAANVLTRTTSVLAALFFVTSIALALTARSGESDSDIAEELTGERVIDPTKPLTTEDLLDTLGTGETPAAAPETTAPTLEAVPADQARPARGEGAREVAEGGALGLQTGKGGAFLFHPPGHGNDRDRSSGLAEGTGRRFVKRTDVAEPGKGGAHQAGKPAVTAMRQAGRAGIDHEKWYLPFGGLAEHGGAQLALREDRDFGFPVIEKLAHFDRRVGGWRLDDHTFARWQIGGAGQKNRYTIILYQPAREGEEGAAGLKRRRVKPCQPPGRTGRTWNILPRFAALPEVIKGKAD